jgi:NTE family protein
VDPTLRQAVTLAPQRIEADAITTGGEMRLGTAAQSGIDRLARALAGATVGLALSGGAAQGVAHLGVMQALLDAGVPIDLIVGTSGGSLYGSLVACGMPVQRAQQAVIHHTRYNLIDRADFMLPRRGIIRGARIEAMLRSLIGNLTFDDLVFPLHAVATDLDTGEEVVLSQGLVYQAVRASISVPGLFAPYRLGGRTLVDGGVVNPMPVSVARQMGASYVIAVQVPAPGKASDNQERVVSRQLSGEHNLLTTFLRCYYFAGDELAKQGAAEADVFIRPPVAHFGWRDYRSAPAIIQAGLEAGRAAVQQIAAKVPIAFGPRS